MNRSAQTSSSGAYRHEAVLYDGVDDFLATAVPFVREAQAAHETVLAVLPASRIASLRAALDTTDGVQFRDMSELGENPARLIPAWRDFVQDHAADGRPVRGLGEPIWPERDPSRLAECLIYESLIDLAFSDDPPFTLLCMYDMAELDPETVAELGRHHGTVRVDGDERAAGHARRSPEMAHFDEYPLPPVPDHALTVLVEDEPPVAVRRFMEDFAEEHDLGSSWTNDLVLAVNEVVTNTALYAPADGASLAVWLDDGTVTCEVRDAGHITDPLVGRRRPRLEAYGGRGLWIVNQLCNLVQIRSGEAGTTVRFQLRAR